MLSKWWSFNIGIIGSIRWSLMKMREVEIFVLVAWNQYLVLAIVVKNAGGYIHHKSCVELPIGLHHPSHPNHPLILFDKYTFCENNREEYDKFRKCNVCGEKSLEYSYFCYRCNFNIHIRCYSLSLTIQTKVHDHQLTRIWKLLKFTCDFYGKKGNLPYLYAQCDFGIHSRHAACPRKLKVYRHNHTLHLTPSLEVHQSDSPICWLCSKSGYTLALLLLKMWFCCPPLLCYAPLELGAHKFAGT